MNNPLVQPDPGLYIWTIATFLVLVTLLAKFAWRPLLEALDRRREIIRKSLDDARLAREEVERLHRDSTRILAEARAQAEIVRERTIEDAARLREELRVKAQEEADRIIKNAERHIQIETRKAVRQIRTEAIDLSVDIASKILRRNVTKEDNERLIGDVLQQLDAADPH